MFATIIFLLVFIFRRSLFGWLVGARGLYLLDAFIFTVMTAWMLAVPGPWPILSYIVAAACVLIAAQSAWAFIQLGDLHDDK